MTQLFDIDVRVGGSAINKHLKNIKRRVGEKSGYFQNRDNHLTWCL